MALDKELKARLAKIIEAKEAKKQELLIRLAAAKKALAEAEAKLEELERDTH